MNEGSIGLSEDRAVSPDTGSADGGEIDVPTIDTRAPMRHSETMVDYDVHGLLGIQLLNPTARDLRTIEHQLGLSPATSSQKPAITIRFVDSLESETAVRYLGREDVGFTDDSFIILRSRNLARARARIDFEKIGHGCEITCEKGLPAIPLLRPLLNMVMLARGIVPVHATGFNYRGQGVLVTGWSHGSKTGTLLAFMAAGAEFVGDEWIYLDPGTDRMYGLPDQLEARPWYLRELPSYARNLRSIDRIRMAATKGLARVLAPFVPASERLNTLGNKLLRQVHQMLLDQQSVHMQPKSLFGAELCSLSSELNVVIVAISCDTTDLQLQATSVEHVAKQLAASFVHEQGSLFATYQKHLFAFPDRRNKLFDNAQEVYQIHALHALARKRAYTMLHPYPVSTVLLRQAIEPLLGGSGSSAAGS